MVLEVLESDLMMSYRAFFNCERFAIEIDGEKCCPCVNERGIDSVFRYEYKGRWLEFERFLCNVESAGNKEVEEIKRFAKEYFTNKKSNIVGERGNV